MEISITQPVDVIKQKADQQFIAHGFSTVKNGETVPDEEKMKRAVHDVVVQKVVGDKTEKSKNSITAGELYARIFPNAPGTDPSTNLDALDYEDDEVRRVLVRKVWTLTNANRTGYIQKRLGEDGGSLVLCRTTVMRGLDPVVGCFVTDNADLIMIDSLQPQIESLVKKADNLRKHVDMIGGRHPEIEARMAKALGLGVQRTVAALPAPSSNGSTAGADDKPGSKAEDKSRTKDSQ